jgi:hypothetical protein
VGADVGAAAAAVAVVVGAAAVAVLQEHSPDGAGSAGPVASFHVSNGLLDVGVARSLEVWGLRRKATENIHMVLRSRWFK